MVLPQSPGRRARLVVVRADQQRRPWRDLRVERTINPGKYQTTWTWTQALTWTEIAQHLATPSGGLMAATGGRQSNARTMRSARQRS